MPADESKVESVFYAVLDKLYGCAFGRINDEIELLEKWLPVM